MPSKKLPGMTAPCGNAPNQPAEAGQKGAWVSHGINWQPRPAYQPAARRSKVGSGRCAPKSGDFADGTGQASAVATKGDHAPYRC